MINILEIDPILTVFPYALLYYGLLLLSSGLALLADNRSENENKRALQTALVIIFVSQLLLLTTNLLAYQGFQLVRALFPLAHRVLNLLCLLWLIWALFRSQSKNITGWIPAILSLAIFLSGILFSLWWLPDAQSQEFNRSWMDYALIGFTLVLVFVSAIIFYTRHRTHLVEGWLILAIAAAGFVLYLLLPSPGNLPAAAMISQLVYYPLLLSLVSNQDQTDNEPVDPKTEPNGDLRANVANAFLEVSLQPSQDELEKSLTHSLSLYLMADLFGLIHFEPGSDQALLKNAYDLIREDHVKNIVLKAERMPILFKMLVEGESILSNHKSELSAEKNYLVQASGYNRVGNLLLYPLKQTANQPRWAFLGLSPYTNKEWGKGDLERLDRLQHNLGSVLEKAGRLEQEARQISDLQTLLLQKEDEVSLLQTNVTENQAELQNLSKELQQTQSAWTEEVKLWIKRQKELEEELERLQQTIKESQASVAESEFLRSQKKQLEETIARNAEQTAQLKAAIDQASSLLQGLTDQGKTADEAEESKG